MAISKGMDTHGKNYTYQRGDWEMRAPFYEFNLENFLTSLAWPEQWVCNFRTGEYK